MTLASVTGPTGTVQLAANTYDGTTLGALLDPTLYNGPNSPSYQPTPILHDSNYGTSFSYRGNPTSSSQMGTTTNTAYLITGVPYLMQDGDGMTVNVSTDGSTANSLPSVLTPNSNGNLSTSMSYNSSFGLTSVTGPNSATQSVNYDFYNRPSPATSVDGAVTNYTYTYAPNTQTATISTTVNSTTTTQWKTTTFDGFGRPIRVQTGNNGVAVTNVDTQYGPCGCSPLGKMTATYMPYAPGAAVYRTTNAYDGGRTLSQTKPDGSVTHFLCRLCAVRSKVARC